jgi:hypothetical protein
VSLSILRSRSPRLLRAPLGAFLLLAFVAGCGNANDEAAAHAAHGEGVPAPMPVIPDTARVFFVTPSDGATVVGPISDGKVTVHVQMGVEGLTVMPAGTLADGGGHHHIIVDGDPVPRGTAVPADAQHIHYGLGQTEAGTHGFSLRIQHKSWQALVSMNRACFKGHWHPGLKAGAASPP